MKSILSLFLLPLWLSSQTFEWVKFPGEESYSCGLDIVTDTAGNCYTLGIHGIMKYDARGKGEQFWKGIAENGNLGIETIAMDAKGAIYIAGLYSGEVGFGNNKKLSSKGNNVMDVFIAKISAAGICQWVKTATGGDAIFQYNVIKRISVDAAGNCYVAGKFDEEIFFGNISMKSVGRYDFFIGKYDTKGTLLWVKQISSDADDMLESIYGITHDAGGNCYITGVAAGSGPRAENCTLTKGAFVGKYNKDGMCVWMKSIGEKDFQGPCISQDIGVDASGKIYITGYFDGTIIHDELGTPFLMKMDADGGILWTKLIKAGSADAAAAKSLVVDKNGNSYVAGSFTDTLYFTQTQLVSYGKEDLFVARYNSNGELKWAGKAGGSDRESADVICLDNSGNIYVSGEIASYTATFSVLNLKDIYTMVDCSVPPCGGPFVAKLKAEVIH